MTPGPPQPLGAGGEALSPTAAKVVLLATPMVIVIDGDYFQTVSFVRQLQTGVSRAFLINGMQIAKQGSAATAGSKVAMTITGKVFSMPGSSTTSAGAAGSATPAATPAVTPAATPGMTPAATPGTTPAATPGASSGAAIALPAPTSGGTRW
jgi:uncharacterized Zn-binding protein involved in type VI secretion